MLLAQSSSFQAFFAIAKIKWYSVDTWWSSTYLFSSSSQKHRKMSSIKVNKIKKEKSDLHFNYPTLCMNLSDVRDIDIARPYISSSIILCKYIYYLLDVKHRNQNICEKYWCRWTFM